MTLVNGILDSRTCPDSGRTDTFTDILKPCVRLGLKTQCLQGDSAPGHCPLDCPATHPDIGHHPIRGGRVRVRPHPPWFNRILNDVASAPGVRMAQYKLSHSGLLNQQEAEYAYVYGLVAPASLVVLSYPWPFGLVSMVSIPTANIRWKRLKAHKTGVNMSTDMSDAVAELVAELDNRRVWPKSKVDTNIRSAMETDDGSINAAECERQWRALVRDAAKKIEKIKGAAKFDSMSLVAAYKVGEVCLAAQVVAEIRFKKLVPGYFWVLKEDIAEYVKLNENDLYWCEALTDSIPWKTFQRLLTVGVSKKRMRDLVSLLTEFSIDEAKSLMYIPEDDDKEAWRAFFYFVELKLLKLVPQRKRRRAAYKCRTNEREFCC